MKKILLTLGIALIASISGNLSADTNSSTALSKHIEITKEYVSCTNTKPKAECAAAMETGHQQVIKETMPDSGNKNSDTFSKILEEDQNKNNTSIKENLLSVDPQPKNKKSLSRGRFL